MKCLESDICQIVCETGLAAINHGLFEQGEIIRTTLPYLVEDTNDRKVLEAAFLIGLKRTYDATTLLANESSEGANILRQLIESTSAGKTSAVRTFRPPRR